MNLKADSLAKKIGSGYVLLILVLAIAVVVTIIQVRQVNDSSDRISNLRFPTSQASLAAMNGMNHSLAALRGWILFGDQKFIDERELAWEEEIRTSFTQMETLSQNWTNPESIERLNTLSPLVDRLYNLQNDVESIASSDPEQAKSIMEDQVVPVSGRIRNILVDMADNQRELMIDELNGIDNQISRLSNTEWILFSIGVLLSTFLSIRISRGITTPIGEAVNVAQDIGNGNLQKDVNINGTKEIRALGTALANMRDSLITKTEETERHDWITSGQNKLYQVSTGDKNTEDLADEIIRFMAEYTGASIGSIFLFDDTREELSLVGRYAYGKGEVSDHFKLGEGTIGQVAVDQKSLILRDMDEKNIKVRSAVIDAPPRNVFIAPFLFQGETLGVMELGKFEEFTDDQMEFVESNLESIGIVLNSALARKKIQQLLEETQSQSEELQQQQEELEQSNEELEEQTQKLKEQQEELQAANEELEEQAQIVEEKNRNLETARSEIELKAKQLEVRSKYKSEFLANMSHELRTPLNSLLILSNDLSNNKSGNLDEDQVESAKIIARNGNDLLTLINEILDLSKIEAGKMILDIRNARIQDIAESIKKDFGRIASEKGLELRIEIDKDLPENIQTDEQRVYQVIRNLVSNALKFTKKGHVRVAFNRMNDNQLGIEVEDSGIGISKDKQEAIFGAFQQAEGGTARKYGGTGLGLSISRELADLLGGSIALESEPNKGSTFNFIIPLECNVDKQPINQEERPKRDTSQDFLQRNVDQYLDYPAIADQRDEISKDDNVVLIIEDDADFAQILADQSSSKGFKFVCASTGEDGLRLAEMYKPIAILLDIELPGINGHIVLKELKGNPDLRHIPVHIMSVDEKSLDPIKSGAIEYLTKPISKKQLDGAFRRIENFIERKMKNLLVIEDDEDLRKVVLKLIGNGDVQCFEAGTGEKALQIIDKEKIDCIVLDIGLPDITGFKLVQEIEKICSQNGELYRMPPIIVYTGKELTRQENDELRKYAETIIVKGVKSEERLLDETALFLHRAVKNLPAQKQEMITGLYDKETIFHRKKVLLVDDDMRNVFALTKVLKEKGLEVVKAENGIRALEVLKENSDTQLVLMDIMMPEMDGYECMREIRKQRMYKDVPIIALTAKAMKEDRQKCINAGADDYITKPVDIERLFSLMRVWIAK